MKIGTTVALTDEIRMLEEMKRKLMSATKKSDGKQLRHLEESK